MRQNLLLLRRFPLGAWIWFDTAGRKVDPQVFDFEVCFLDHGYQFNFSQHLGSCTEKLEAVQGAGPSHCLYRMRLTNAGANQGAYGVQITALLQPAIRWLRCFLRCHKVLSRVGLNG